MHIDSGGFYGAVSHQGFEGKQVGAVLIVVSGKRMAEGVAGKAVVPPQFPFMETDKIGDTLVVDGFGGVPLLCEKPIPGTFLRWKRIPVLQDQLPGLFRKLGIAGRTVFRRAHEDPALGMFNVRAPQMADFADPQAGGEHEAEKSLEFQVRDGRKEKLHFFPCRDKRKERIKLPEGELVRIPGFMKDIEGKKAQL